jgi:hypothetical protein
MEQVIYSACSIFIPFPNGQKPISGQFRPFAEAVKGRSLIAGSVSIPVMS